MESTENQSDMATRSKKDVENSVAHALIFGDLPEEETAAKTFEEPMEETMEDFKQRLIHWIGQMMFVSGETAEPSPETTWMIEEIVREQVVEMVCHFSRASSRSV